MFNCRLNYIDTPNLAITKLSVRSKTIKQGTHCKKISGVFDF